jgi:hypothetical protein
MRIPIYPLLSSSGGIKKLRTYICYESNKAKYFIQEIENYKNKNNIISINVQLGKSMKKRGMLTNTSFNVTQANKKVAELTFSNISCTSNKK